MDGVAVGVRGGAIGATARLDLGVIVRVADLERAGGKPRRHAQGAGLPHVGQFVEQGLALGRRIGERDDVADREGAGGHQLAGDGSGVAGEGLDRAEVGAELLLDLGEERQLDLAGLATDVLDQRRRIVAVELVLDPAAEPVRELVGLALVGVVGARHLAAARRGAAQVLRDVGGLVGDQLDAGVAGGVVGAGGEVDVVADGERPRPQGRRGLGGAVVGVDAEPRQIDAELGGEPGGQLGRQGLAGAGLLEKRERRGQ